MDRLLLKMFVQLVIHWERVMTMLLILTKDLDSEYLNFIRDKILAFPNVMTV